jgi:hypothetical protein
MIEGCDQCERRTRCDGDCDDLCRMIAESIQDDEGHESWHRASLCAGCGADLGPGVRLVTTRCQYGNCRIHSCGQCGTERYGDGPVGCRCNTTAFTRFLLRVWWPLTEWLRRRADA